jgi:hypothetical protein
VYQFYVFQGKCGWSLPVLVPEFTTESQKQIGICEKNVEIPESNEIRFLMVTLQFGKEEKVSLILSCDKQFS